MESDKNNLFHFTSSVGIKGILESKEFWVMHSPEDHQFLYESVKGTYDGALGNRIISKVAYPMVCFCDIPLKRIKNHTKKFGYFGLGMKREWAKRNGICPVHYIDEKGLPAKLWYETITQMDYVLNIHENVKIGHEEYFKNLLNLATFIKPYNKGDRVFYDEREWRYFPPKEVFGEKYQNRFLEKNETKDEIEDYKQKNGSLKSGYKLSFDFDDINVLIVPNCKQKRILKKLLKEKGYPKIKIKTWKK